MHELSVTEGLLNIVTDQVNGTGVSRVCGINLVIGDLASIVDDSVQFYFDILSKGTVAENALLNIRRVIPEFTCRNCSHRFVRENHSYRCLACGGNDVEVTRGQEFYIESIEVEDED